MIYMIYGLYVKLLKIIVIRLFFIASDFPFKTFKKEKKPHKHRKKDRL